MAIRKLRDELSQLLQEWRSDLSPAWSTALGNTEPDLEAVSSVLTLASDEVIFPGRKGHPPAGARADSHMFRALDAITPDHVRVVVMGQDPYTLVQRATGRSFEQGDLSDWLGTPVVTPSLRRIIQAVAMHRTGDAKYAAGKGWNQVVEDIKGGRLKIEPARELWDNWQSQGVVFINAILTFNRFDPDFQFRGHQPLWAPTIRQLLKHLAGRPGRPLVCVGWGNKAQDVLKDGGVQEAAEAAGTWNTSVRIVKGPHPNAPPTNAPPFLAGRDPLGAVNDAIAATGGQPVHW